MKFNEPAQGRWALQFDIVQIKDSTIRICVGYHKANTVTTSTLYPLPRMNALILLDLRKAFFTFDAKSLYWQIEMHESDRDNTALSLLHSLFQFNSTAFGL